ncbi:MAG: autotransporter domain-containing protein [Parvibaculum sp.]|nr:autotransporter domain-containing protein [Parvibaculum sp.]
MSTSKIKPAGIRNNTTERLARSAYTYYGGVVQTTGDAPKSARGIKRLFAAAMLSGASIMAVGLAGTAHATLNNVQVNETLIIVPSSNSGPISESDVHDLSVVVPVGTVIDTRSETSEADFDNAGVFITGDGNLSIVNNGTIVTGDTGYYFEFGEEEGFWTYDGNRHHGIAAYSDDNASVTNTAFGTIATTRPSSHGAIARAIDEEGMSGGNATANNAGLIGTTGQNSFGVAAVAKYTASVDNSGTVTTSGDGGHGLYAYAKYDIVIDNSGSIETSGEGAHGIVAVIDDEWTEESGTVEIGNSGTIETTGDYAYGISVEGGEAAVDIVNSGSISTEGYSADGISVSGGVVSITNADEGSIWTTDEYSFGINASGETVTVVNAGTIFTDGGDAIGVSLHGETVSLDNSGTIKTYGEDAHAVVASSYSDLTTTIYNTGLIAAYGDESDAIVASGPTVRITNALSHDEEGELVSTGTIISADGAAIRIDEADFAYVYNDGLIYGNVQIEAEEYARVENTGGVYSDRRWKAAIGVDVDEGDAYVLNDTTGIIVTTARNASGIEVWAEDFAEIVNKGSITTGGDEGWSSGRKSHGIDAYGENGVLVVNTGDITTHGKRAYAIRAVTDGDEAAQAISSGTIVTHGKGSIGIAAEARGGSYYSDYHAEEIYYGSDAIAGNVGGVTTYGEDAIGVIAVSKYEDAIAYNMLDGTIATSGDNAHGLVAASGFSLDEFVEGGYGGYGSEHSGNAAAINGLPLYYGGMFFLGGYGEWNAHASIFEHVDFGEGVNFPEDVDLTEFRPSIVTTGDNAIGVLAVSSGSNAFAANFNGNVTTGTDAFDDEGDPVGGYRSYGIAAFSEGGDAIAMNALYGSILTFGDGAHGAVAGSEDGDATAMNKYSSTIVTHGDGAKGLYAWSHGEADEYGSADATAWNLGSSIVTYGDEGAHGIHVTAEGGRATAANVTFTFGDEGEEETFHARIETHGDGSHGIRVFSDEGDAAVYNSGDIVTYGDYAQGIRVTARHEVYVENTGTITTHGDYAYGIRAYAYNSSIEIDNSGDIVTGGHEADGIVAYADDEYGVIEILNSGLIHATGEASDAIIASGYSVTITNTVDGQILADDNDGIEIDNAAIARVFNWGTISASESAIEIDESGDVAVYNYGSIVGRVDIEEAESAYFLNDEDATVLVENEKTAGVRLLAFEEANVVNRGSIETTADGTRGVQLRGSSVSLDNSGSISTSGDNAHAVVAHSNWIATTTIYNSGTIAATGEGADAIQASGPTVFITNTEDGTISSADGIAIDVFETKYASIINHGTVTGDIHVSAYDFEDFGSTYILNTGSVSGDIDTSFGESHDTIIVDGGTVGGAIYTGEGEDTVTISGTGVSIARGIHGGSGYESDLHVYFEQEDTVTFDGGNDEGYAISNAHFVGFYGGTTVFDGVNIHTRDEGSIHVGEGGILATTAEGAYAIAVDTQVDGRLRVAGGGTFGFSGDVAFNEGSTFETGLTGAGGGVVAGDTVHFDAGATIHVNAGAGFTQTVGEDVLVASAASENGVTDDGAAVTDNLILFKFLKVMNDEVVTEGAADDLFLRIEVEDTAFDLETEAAGSTKNKLSMAAALDVYIQSQPIDNPLVQYLLQFETEEEQLAALLKVIQDTLPDESNATGSATITTTDLVFDMIMDRLSGGGFSVAQGGETGVAAGEAALGGSGNWAIWGRMGALRAKYTPGAVNGFDADTWGGTVGIDGEVAPNLRAGFGYFYMDSKVEENGAGANSRVDIVSHGVTGYVSYRPGAWYVNGTLGYGINDYDSRRNSLGGVNVASFDGTQFVARGEVGRMFTEGQWDITPNAGLRYNRVDLDAYTETGPLPITVNARTVESLRGVVGVNLRHTTALEGGGKLIPEFGVKFLNELANPDEAITGAIVGGGAFVTQQTPRDDLSIGIGGGLTWEASDKFSLRITYDGEFQSDYDEQSLAASVRFAF